MHRAVVKRRHDCPTPAARWTIVGTRRNTKREKSPVYAFIRKMVPLERAIAFLDRADIFASLGIESPNDSHLTQE